MITLYNAVSEDGFIARENGDEDFIPNEVWNEYVDLCKKFDAVVNSRKAYEAIQNYPEKAVKEYDYLNVKKFVITKNKDYVTKSQYKVIHSIKEIVAFGKNILISSGPEFNDVLLKEKIIDKIILNIIPVKIGKGIKAFINEPKLKLISEKHMNNGRKWREYMVIK
jgi:dihydrofolate reductase